MTTDETSRDRRLLKSVDSVQSSGTYITSLDHPLVVDLTHTGPCLIGTDVFVVGREGRNGRDGGEFEEDIPVRAAGDQCGDVGLDADEEPGEEGIGSSWIRSRLPSFLQIFVPFVFCERWSSRRDDGQTVE